VAGVERLPAASTWVILSPCRPSGIASDGVIDHCPLAGTMVDRMTPAAPGPLMRSISTRAPGSPAPANTGRASLPSAPSIGPMTAGVVGGVRSGAGGSGGGVVIGGAGGVSSGGATGGGGGTVGSGVGSVVGVGVGSGSSGSSGDNGNDCGATAGGGFSTPSTANAAPPSATTPTTAAATSSPCRVFPAAVAATLPLAKALAGSGAGRPQPEVAATVAGSAPEACASSAAAAVPPSTVGRRALARRRPRSSSSSSRIEQRVQVARCSSKRARAAGLRVLRA
jgi:hypothetical protein